jgi:hypothetical protein
MKNTHFSYLSGLAFMAGLLGLATTTNEDESQKTMMMIQ